MQYRLVRSKRRSLALQIKRGGELVVRAPYLVPQFMIRQFVASHEEWIKRNIKKLSRQEPERARVMTDEKLQEIIKKFVAQYSAILAVTPRALRFKSVSSYWGSCAPSGIISFNKALARTSADAVEYVVVHELAHLRYRGHGRRFWNLVRATYPKTNEMRAFLRQISRGNR